MGGVRRVGVAGSRGTLQLDHPVIHVLLWIGAGVSTFHAAYWLAAVGQVWLTMRGVPTGMSVARRRAGRAAEGEAPSVCVIVPAHNEEAHIERIARSLLAQTHGRLRVVFALDRCTDGTLERLRAVVGDDARCSIVEVTHCPDDWAGKPHAIWTAVRESPAARESELVAFIDADTQLDDRCIAATARLLRERWLDLVSLLSTLTHERWFERIAQPPATFELMRQYPIRRANATVDPDGRPGRLARRPFANGQFILVRREVYDELGGHEAIRDKILEDVELSRRFARSGKRTGVFIADGLIRCRMYESFDEFRTGWNRIYRESVHREPRRLRAYARRLRTLSVYVPGTVVVAMVLAAVCLLGLEADQDDVGLRRLAWSVIGMGLLGMSAFWGMLAAAYHIGQTGWRWAFTYPYGSWQVARILDDAAADLEAGKPIRWGGRTYDAGRAGS